MIYNYALFCFKYQYSIVYLCFTRQSDRFYNNGDIFMVHDGDTDIGIENLRHDIDEYADKPLNPSISGPMRTNSAASFRTNSAISLKDINSVPSSSPTGETRKGTPVMHPKKAPRTKTPLIVPQTDV